MVLCDVNNNLKNIIKKNLIGKLTFLNPQASDLLSKAYVSIIITGTHFKSGGAFPVY
jgi:hypothetical protein